MNSNLIQRETVAFLIIFFDYTLYLKPIYHMFIQSKELH